MGVLGGRLWTLQVTEENRYALLADENRINVQMLGPERGRIIDRFGVVLANNRESFRAVLVPSLVRDVPEVLARFAKIVPVPSEDLQRHDLRAKRQSPNIPIVIAQDLTFENIAAINLQAPFLPGIATEPAPRRQYFQGKAMSQIVGQVGANERLAMDDSPLLRLPGARIGKTGVESGMEELLRGKPGLVHSEVDSRGRIVRHLDRTEPVVGQDITLTVDAELQGQIMRELGAFRRAATVVIDVVNGDVLAAASVPSFDANDVVNGVTRRSWNRLQTQRDDPMMNRATRGMYPPGSTFKMVVGLAALEAGVVSLKERIGCDGRFDYHEQTFRCWKRMGHGTCDMHMALRESCDCYFYELARRIGIEAIASMARKLGLGQIYDSGIAGLKRGIIPDPEWKRGRFGKGWLGGETILTGIGQGYTLTTPLQLAVMTARLASGRQVTPTFVKRAGDAAPRSPMPLAVKPEFLNAMRRGMTAVVNEANGTGSKAQPESGGYVVAGKTGTSQVSRHSSETAQEDLRWELRDHALFVSYAPAAKPKYAMATVIEHGGGGGSVAAPLSRTIMDLVMERDPAGKSSLSEVTSGRDDAAANGAKPASKPSGREG